jgi:NAD(P)-dependent dehydrogenase (short-subunit alcohol dehydrogenase family)
MIVCPQCSAENRSGARFCDSCAAALTSSAAALQQQRKTVTVLFCDVAGSTELGERLDPEALRDATDPDQLGQFFEGLTEPIDHVMVTAGGSYYASIADMDFAQVRRAFDEHLVLPMQVAAAAARKMRPGGTLIFMTGTAARHPAVGSAIAAILAAAVPAITANLALELAPIRVNLIAAGFVDTPLSASLMGDDLEKRRQQLRETLPVRRVVEPTDIGSLAVYLMSNTAVTGATYDIDGGQQLLPAP